MHSSLIGLLLFQDLSLDVFSNNGSEALLLSLGFSDIVIKGVFFKLSSYLPEALLISGNLDSSSLVGSSGLSLNISKSLSSSFGISLDLLDLGLSLVKLGLFKFGIFLSDLGIVVLFGLCLGGNNDGLLLCSGLGGSLGSYCTGFSGSLGSYLLHELVSGGLLFSGIL